MESSNQKKAKLLGMPFGTANGKLKKMLLWHFATKLKMLVCYHCGELIETLEEFSIEHTEPWMSAADPVGVFFDVEKIAFSHINCNVGAAIHPNTRKVVGGKLRCSICGGWFQKDSFHKASRDTTGRTSECKRCAIKDILIVPAVLVCCACGEKKSSSDFHIDRYSATGRRYMCKECRKTKPKFIPE